MAKPCEHLQNLTVADLPPAAVNLLMCCSRPCKDLAIDI